MSALLKNAYISLRDYFALDYEGGERYEYYNGEIFNMSGGTPNHNSIAVSAVIAFGTRLNKSSCRVFNSDQRVKVHVGSPYLYPDVVIAYRPRFEMINHLPTLLNPLLIIEVLSPSSAAHDRSSKFNQYQSIESLRHYLLIDATACGVVHYQKTADTWQPLFFDQPESILTFDFIDFNLRIALSEFYTQVDWDAAT